MKNILIVFCFEYFESFSSDGGGRLSTFTSCSLFTLSTSCLSNSRLVFLDTTNDGVDPLVTVLGDLLDEFLLSHDSKETSSEGTVVVEKRKSMNKRKSLR